MMQNKKFCSIIIVFLFLIIVVTLFVVNHQFNQIERLKQGQICLIEGDKIDYFDLIGTDNQRIDSSALKEGHHLIFVMEQPCIPCNHNLTLWRRMAKIAQDEANIYGIWLGDPTEMFNFQDEGDLGFILYAPVDVEKVKEKLKLNLNYAQTILYSGNEVVFIRLGKLEGQNYTDILRYIKQTDSHSERNTR